MLHPRSVPRATPLGAAASGANGGLRLLPTSFWVDVAHSLQAPQWSCAHPSPWPLHTRFITSSPKHKTMTSTMEIESEAQSRCRGSVCGGGQPALPTLSVSPLARSSCTPDFLQPHSANVSVSSLRSLIRVSEGQRPQVPLASILPDFEGSAA